MKYKEHKFIKFLLSALDAKKIEEIMQDTIIESSYHTYYEYNSTFTYNRGEDEMDDFSSLKLCMLLLNTECAEGGVKCNLKGATYYFYKR